MVAINKVTRKFCVYLAFVLGILPLVVSAQSTSALTEISLAERSDNNGYVFRMEIVQKADSFKVFQPDAGLIQFLVYTNQIDTAAITMPELSPPFDALSLHTIPNGLGFDLYLQNDSYFIADMYPDKNSSDVLLALTNASQEDVDILTKDLEPIAWQKMVLPEDFIPESSPEELEDSVTNDIKDDSYYQIKDKLQFDRIVIDAGHGGRDPGAIGYRGVQEKEIVLKVAKKLGGYLNKYIPEVEVIYTRDDDSFVGLTQRGTIANHAEGDLFVSLHCNAARSHRARGTEVYFLGLHRSESAFEVMKKENSVVRLEDGVDKTKTLSEEDLVLYELANSGYMATSQDLAVRMEEQFGERAQRRSRGVKQAGFMVLYHASMPAILVELGFISNPSEQRFLTSDYGQSIMASAIFRAIRNYKNDYDERMNMSSTK